jgi:hypothetical protein
MCMTEFCNWKFIKHRLEDNAIKSWQETQLYQTTIKRNLIFLLVQTEFMTFWMTTKTWPQKWGHIWDWKLARKKWRPIVGLRFGRPIFKWQKRTQKEDQLFDSDQKKNKLDIPIFIRKLQYKIQIENMKYWQSCKRCTTHTPSIDVNTTKKIQRNIQFILKFQTKTKTDKLKCMCICVYRTSNKQTISMNIYTKLLKTLKLYMKPPKNQKPWCKNPLRIKNKYWYNYKLGKHDTDLYHDQQYI